MRRLCCVVWPCAHSLQPPPPPPLLLLPLLLPLMVMAMWIWRLRLMSDLKQLNTDPPDGVSASPVSDDNMYLWQATIIGPDESPWEGGSDAARSAVLLAAAKVDADRLDRAQLGREGFGRLRLARPDEAPVALLLALRAVLDLLVARLTHHLQRLH